MNPDFYYGGGHPTCMRVSNFSSALSPAFLMDCREVNNGQSLSNSTRSSRRRDCDHWSTILNTMQYFTFAHDGSLQPTGSPSVRDFATQAYDEYVQDTWKVRPSLTLDRWTSLQS